MAANVVHKAFVIFDVIFSTRLHV